jgi:hypothetical protein
MYGGVAYEILALEMCENGWSTSIDAHFNPWEKPQYSLDITSDGSWCWFRRGKKMLKFHVMSGNRTVIAFWLMTESTAVVKFCPVSHRFRCPLHEVYPSTKPLLNVIKMYTHILFQRNGTEGVDSHLDEFFSQLTTLSPTKCTFNVNLWCKIYGKNIVCFVGLCCELIIEHAIKIWE